jgi:hypothetical protein
MKSGYRAWLSVILLVLVGLWPARAQEARSDAQELTRLYEQCREELQDVDGSSLYYGGTVQEAEAVSVALDKLEEEVLQEIRPFLATFRVRYGETAEQVNEAMLGAAVLDQGDVGGRYELLCRAQESVDRTRSASASQMARKASMLAAHVELYSRDMQARKLEDARALLEIGAKLDPGNKSLEAHLDDIKGQLAELFQVTPD